MADTAFRQSDDRSERDQSAPGCAAVRYGEDAADRRPNLRLSRSMLTQSKEEFFADVLRQIDAEINPGALRAPPPEKPHVRTAREALEAEAASLRAKSRGADFDRRMKRRIGTVVALNTASLVLLAAPLAGPLPYPLLTLSLGTVLAIGALGMFLGCVRRYRSVTPP